jgi:CheY-like chemotaxis protein
MTTGSQERERAMFELVAEWASVEAIATLGGALPRMSRVISYDRLWLEHPALDADARPHAATPGGALVAAETTTTEVRDALRAARHHDAVVLVRPDLIGVPLIGARRGALALDRAAGFEPEHVARAALLAPVLARTLDRVGAADAARAEARAADAFLGLLGHDLRSALATVAATVEAIAIGAAPPTCLDVIDRQVAHMVRLACDLTDVSRIARGTFELDLRPVELAEVIATAVERLRGVLPADRDVRADVPRRGLVVLGDLERLSRVVARMVQVAARSSVAGATLVVTGVRDQDRAVIEVRSSVEAPRAVPWPRASTPRMRDLGEEIATAGLVMAHQVAELHRGSFAVIDAPDRARALVLTLPRTSIASAEHEVPSAEAIAAHVRAARSRRVLVVDDDRDLAAVIAGSLERCGHVVAVAHDGVAALATAEAFHPEVGILNIVLPVLDGCGLARALRARCGDGPLRLIALTGYGRDADRARTRAAGFDDHLLKPVDLETITRAVQS